MSNLGRTLSRAYLKWKVPNYDQYASITKMPSNPKVVIYGAYNQLFKHLLQKYILKI